MTFIETLAYILLAFLCVYGLIARICECIEHCASAKGYAKVEEAKILAKEDSSCGTEN